MLVIDADMIMREGFDPEVGAAFFRAGGYRGLLAGRGFWRGGRVGGLAGRWAGRSAGRQKRGSVNVSGAEAEVVEKALGPLKGHGDSPAGPPSGRTPPSA